MPMRRKCTETLMQWKKKTQRRPLVLQGGRQVGKTWLLQDFGEKNYNDVIYINLETERIAADYLSKSGTAEEMLMFLESYADKPIRQSGTLVILDNFHCVTGAETVLAEIGMDFPDYHIAAIEKNGVCRHDPCDVEKITLFPMDFEEFLWANKEYGLAKEVRKHFAQNTPMGKDLHARATAQFRLYLCIGGMPGAVCEYRREKKLLLVPDVQSKILSLLASDIAEGAPAVFSHHARNCFLSIPSQLCRENGRFQYKQVVKGGTAKLYQAPLNWLIDHGMAYRASRKTMENKQENACKYYFPDTGLFCCRLGLPPFMVLSGENIPQGRGLAEMFLAQTFVKNGYHFCQWSTGNQAVVPFLLEKDGVHKAVDFRLDPGEKVRNLSRYHACGNAGKMYLVSTEDFHKKELYDVIPFYAAFCI